MATTKIWPIRKGSSIKLVIEYVENEDKTTTVLYRLETDNNRTYTKPELENMTDVMAYAMQDYKTEEKRLVSGVNVNADSARDEMMITKRQYHKEDGIILWHGYQSFKPGEVDPEEAHKIGLELAKNLWGDDYEVVVCTHVDRAHIHNHFVINSVSFKSGKKLDAKWQDMARESDKLCSLYGKSVIENPRFNGKHYAEWKAEAKGESTWIYPMRDEIDEIISMSESIDDFIGELRKRGWNIKIGKFLTLRPPGKERGVKIDRKFGEMYSLAGIERRIEENVKNGNVVQKISHQKSYRCASRVAKPKQSVTGYQALYFFYCYKLGVFPKRHVSTARTHYVLREELMNINKISDETRFLAENKISTAGELEFYRSSAEISMRGLKEQRKVLQNRSRSATGAEKEALEQNIEKLSKRIKTVSKELYMCKDIKERSATLNEKANVARSMNKPATDKSREREVL